MSCKTVFCTAALLVLLTACGGSSDRTEVRVEDTTTPPSPPSQPVLPSPAPTTPPATTVEGPCPYIQTQQVMDTIGQHLTRSTVTSTRPHPSCAFYRPDDALAAQITVSEAANPTTAQNEALSKVGNSANPADGIGDYGVVAITDDGALLAVTKGTSLVLVKINQKSSLQAKEIARVVVPVI